MYVAEAWLVRLEGFAMGGVRLVQSLCWDGGIPLSTKEAALPGTNQKNKGTRQLSSSLSRPLRLETGNRGGRVGMSDGGVLVLVLFSALLVCFGNIWFLRIFLSLFLSSW